MTKQILIVICLLLTGCATQQQAINGFESAALVSARAANDNLIMVETTALCASPYSAILRHPELWEVMPKLCAPGAREATPASILKGEK